MQIMAGLKANDWGSWMFNNMKFNRVELAFEFHHQSGFVVVQFYPWFKFYFLCFGYANLMIMSLKQRK